MKICSYNVKNNFFKHKNKTNDIISFINKYDIDILGVQEYLFKDAKKFGLENYKCIGKGRLHFKNSIFNESCNIITRLNVIKHNVHKLPWFFTSFPRIMNEIRVKNNGKEYLVINTHLDYLHKISQKKQLNFIFNYLKNLKDAENIILMGDFNLNINNKIFKKFINDLKSININRVEINDKTFKFLDKPIDHIFISNSINVTDSIVIVDKELDISDHYPIYIEIK
ncbi:MAG: endonuclease/exonuclease/phosphatase family protein [Bacilli bacterium]|nr:endonuclease/exonuclease/phosphatase family protein [Bacilli bacterium]